MNQGSTLPQLPLEVDGLSHAYGSHQVVRGLSFSLPSGAIGCLLGPSGCGKTTVLRCIAGFESAQQGTIRINGREVSGAGVAVPPEKRRIGMVFQDYALFPHLSVGENIAFGLRTPGAARDARLAELAGLVGLTAALEKYPHEISGGQQQHRIADIARQRGGREVRPQVARAAEKARHHRSDRQREQRGDQERRPAQKPQGL